MQIYNRATTRGGFPCDGVSEEAKRKKTEVLKMKKYLILCYEEGRNPFPIKEETKRTKKSKKEIFLQYRKNFDIVKIFEID